MRRSACPPESRARYNICASPASPHAPYIDCMRRATATLCNSSIHAVLVYNYVAVCLTTTLGCASLNFAVNAAGVEDRQCLRMDVEALQESGQP
jgi:hypothetical protein